MRNRAAPPTYESTPRRLEEYDGPLCPFCIGAERAVVVDVDERGRIILKLTQWAHDRACPASHAPVGSAWSGHDMTADMIADARRPRRIS